MGTFNASRRRAVAAVAAFMLPRFAWSQSAGAEIEVWKSPSCGCCKDWITHLEKAGFRVKTHETGNNAIRAQLRMPAKYGSCHTGKISGYAIEGHVPASDIQRLLREKPAAVGLSVPNMPVGSPGMDGPAYGNQQDPYDVLLVQTDGSAKVYASYGKQGAK